MNTATPTVILTRPQPGADRFAEALANRFDGIRVVIAPLQDIEFLAPRPVTPTPAGLIFTSQNGVLAWNRLKNPPRAVAFCVGPQTTQRALDFGLDAVNCGGDAEALIADILRLRPTGRLLHFRGEHGRGRIAERLSEAGIPTIEQVVYRQNALSPTPELTRALAEEDPIVPLFSPRSAALLAGVLPEGASPQLAVISQATADRLDPALRHRMIVAKTPDSEGMLDAIAACLSAKREP